MFIDSIVLQLEFSFRILHDGLSRTNLVEVDVSIKFGQSVLHRVHLIKSFEVNHSRHVNKELLLTVVRDYERIAHINVPFKLLVPP